jgi:hypothetical protein
MVSFGIRWLDKELIRGVPTYSVMLMDNTSHHRVKNDGPTTSIIRKGIKEWLDTAASDTQKMPRIVDLLE